MAGGCSCVSLLFLSLCACLECEHSFWAWCIQKRIIPRKFLRGGRGFGYGAHTLAANGKIYCRSISQQEVSSTGSDSFPFIATHMHSSLCIIRAAEVRRILLRQWITEGFGSNQEESSVWILWIAQMASINAVSMILTSANNP